MKKGDRVQFQGRTGTVVGSMPNGMIDIRFDDATHRTERRSLDRLAKANGQVARNNGSVRVNGSRPDYDTLERALREGGGAAFATKQDVPRISDDQKSYCGNPIDGTAYYIIVRRTSKKIRMGVRKEEVESYIRDYLSLLGEDRAEPSKDYNEYARQTMDGLAAFLKEPKNREVSKTVLTLSPSGGFITGSDVGRARDRGLPIEIAQETKRKGDKGWQPSVDDFYIDSMIDPEIPRNERHYFSRYVKELPGFDKKDRFNAFDFRRVFAKKDGELKTVIAHALNISKKIAEKLIVSGAVATPPVERNVAQRSGVKLVNTDPSCRVYGPQYLPDGSVTEGTDITVMLKDKAQSPFFSWVGTSVDLGPSSRDLPCLSKDQKDAMVLINRLSQIIPRVKNGLGVIRSLVRRLTEDPSAYKGERDDPNPRVRRGFRGKKDQVFKRQGYYSEGRRAISTLASSYVSVMDWMKRINEGITKNKDFAIAALDALRAAGRTQVEASGPVETHLQDLQRHFNKFKSGSGLEFGLVRESGGETISEIDDEQTYNSFLLDYADAADVPMVGPILEWLQGTNTFPLKNLAEFVLGTRSDNLRSYRDLHGESEDLSKVFGFLRDGVSAKVAFKSIYKTDPPSPQDLVFSADDENEYQRLTSTAQTENSPQLRQLTIARQTVIKNRRLDKAYQDLKNDFNRASNLLRFTGELASGGRVINGNTYNPVPPAISESEARNWFNSPVDEKVAKAHLGERNFKNTRDLFRNKLRDDVQFGVMVAALTQAGAQPTSTSTRTAEPVMTNGYVFFSVLSFDDLNEHAKTEVVKLLNTSLRDLIPSERFLQPFKLLKPDDMTDEQFAQTKDMAWSLSLIVNDILPGLRSSLDSKSYARAALEIFVMISVYYTLGGYTLLGPLRPGSDEKPGKLDNLSALLRSAKLSFQGGSSGMGSGGEVSTFMTYNPVLFEATRLFWNEGLSGPGILSNASLMEDIDTVGRYGAAARAVQMAVSTSASEDDVFQRLQALYLPAWRLANTPENLTKILRGVPKFYGRGARGKKKSRDEVLEGPVRVQVDPSSTELTLVGVDPYLQAIKHFAEFNYVWPLGATFTEARALIANNNDTGLALRPMDYLDRFKSSELDPILRRLVNLSSLGLPKIELKPPETLQSQLQKLDDGKVTFDPLTPETTGDAQVRTYLRSLLSQISLIAPAGSVIGKVKSEKIGSASPSRIVRKEAEEERYQPPDPGVSPGGYVLPRRSSRLQITGRTESGSVVGALSRTRERLTIPNPEMTDAEYKNYLSERGVTDIERMLVKRREVEAAALRLFKANPGMVTSRKAKEVKKDGATDIALQWTRTAIPSLKGETVYDSDTYRALLRVLNSPKSPERPLMPAFPVPTQPVFGPTSVLTMASKETNEMKEKIFMVEKEISNLEKAEQELERVIRAAETTAKSNYGRKPRSARRSK